MDAFAKRNSWILTVEGSYSYLVFLCSSVFNEVTSKVTLTDGTPALLALLFLSVKHTTITLLFSFYKWPCAAEV